MSTPTLAPTRWLRLPRRTARLRLTLLYSGMFLVLGTALILIIYAFVAHSSTIAVTAAQGSQSAAPVAPSVRLRSGSPSSPAGVLIRPSHSALVDQHSADNARLLEASWVVLVLTALGSAVLGWFVAGRVLRPLRSIATTARTISAGNLHQRLALSGPDDEFKQLGDTLDELLARLQGSFESQRRFVANASHELRTPLTVERTLLQVAMADPDASAQKLRSTCQEVLAAGLEHERLLESLLTLASSERGLERREPVDLAGVAARVLAGTLPRAEAMSVQLESELEPAVTSGDSALLERLIANLLENATYYNVPGGHVQVKTFSTPAGKPFLSVANSGPVIPTGELKRLLEPFQRLGDDRTGAGDGRHGLGLSIVRAITDAHDAVLEVAAPADGGLTVTVRFQAEE